MAASASSVDVQGEKRRLRKQAADVRVAAWRQHGKDALKDVAEHGLAFLALEGLKTVSGFRAIREEIDPEPLLRVLDQHGHSLALPVIIGKHQPLLFRIWRPGDELGTGQWGIEEPLPSADVVEPDVVLVPLLAVDAQGYRIGYGGGYYDRSLERLREMKPVVSVGLAFDEQKVDAVPHLDYDQRLDWILTPSGPYRCSG